MKKVTETTDLLEVRMVPGKGRGVFAKRDIAKGDVIETAPVLLLGMNALETGVWDYAFAWTTKQVALVLGYGSLYNHSYNPNARYWDLTGKQCKEFSALRDIKAGEEITITYNAEVEDKSPVWFDCEGVPAKPWEAAE